MPSIAGQRTFDSTPLLRSLPKSLSIHTLRDGKVLDYSGLRESVDKRVHEITQLAPEPGGRVVIAMSHPIDVLVTLFACWVANQCAVLVNSNISEDEQQRVIDKTKPHLWLSNDSSRELDGDTQKPAWSNAALILMTSGTTGDPKGVTHSLETLEKRLSLNIEEIGTKALKSTLCPLPLFFGHGLIGNCLTPLLAGQSLHIIESPGLKEFAEFGAIIDRLQVTFLSSVPSMWRMILRLSPPPAITPIRVHVGSAPLPDALWQEVEHWCGTKRIYNTYGMTETANWIGGGTRPKQSNEGFVGAPWGGAFKVVRDGKLESTGRGEVAIRSPSIMLGLWNAQDQPEYNDGYFLTGDIGELAANQTLRLVGRTKNEINRGGIKVLAEEVDMLLERHPDVVEACSFAIPDEMAGELVGAVVRLANGTQSDAGEIISWCRTKARAEAVPHRLAIVDEIPKSDRGKLARQVIQREMIKRWC